MMREAWTLSAALTAEEAMDSSLDMTGFFAPKEEELPRPAVLPNFPFGARPDRQQTRLHSEETDRACHA